MPYTTLNSGVRLKVPTRGTRSWAQTFLDEFATSISAHDHTGSPNGLPIGTNALSANAVNDTKIRLRNDQYLRGRNAAGSGDVDIIKVNASDEIEFPSGTLSGASFADDSIAGTKIRLANNQYLRGRNALGSADVDLLKVDGGNVIQLGNGTNTVNIDGPITFADDQWVAYNPNASPITANSMVFTRSALTAARYCQLGKLVFFHVEIVGTTSGSASPTINIQLPVTVDTMHAGTLAASVADGGAVNLGWGYIDTALSQISILKYDRSNWALAASRYVSVSGFYKAA